MATAGPDNSSMHSSSVDLGAFALSVVAPCLTTETIREAACFVGIKRASSAATLQQMPAHVSKNKPVWSAESPRSYYEPAELRIDYQRV